ncbi:6-bladed beta-propeller [candidate division KSB1 bacterium]
MNRKYNIWSLEMFSSIKFIWKAKIFFIIIILFFGGCSKRDIVFDESKIIQETYSRSPFISESILSVSDTLKQPSVIRVNPGSRDITVLDKENKCLYTFNENGEFLKKISEAGDWSGAITIPSTFEIKQDGTIYINEPSRKVLMLFDKDGEFMREILLDLPLLSPFYISFSDKLLINQPFNEHFFTELFSDGSFNKNIDKISEMPKQSQANIQALLGGSPAVDNDGNYYIYLPRLGVLRIVDSQDTFKERFLLDFIPELKGIFSYFPDPDNLDDVKTYAFYFYDFTLLNNRLYLSFLNHEGEAYNDFKLVTYVINTDLIVEKRIVMVLPEKLDYKPRDNVKIEITDDGNTIYVPMNTKPLILKFTKPDLNK